MTTFSETMASYPRWKRVTLYVCWGLLAAMISLLTIGLAFAPDKPATDAPAHQAKPAPELTSEQRVLAQFSGWDGSHTASVKAIKEAINDPDSFKHAETRYWLREDNTVKVLTVFRARNGFGGMVVARVVTVVDIDGNVLSIEFLK